MFANICFGTIGYHWISDYRWFDAFYMTVITVATVGYGEIQPLNDVGRAFTAVLIFISFGTFAYAVSSITKFVVDGEFNKYFKDRKLTKELDQLENHVIICGYGRNGRQAAHVLKSHNQRFVVIEKEISAIEEVQNKFKEIGLSGDATSDEILLKAGVLKAKAMIITLPVDADNLFIVLSARNLNPKLTIISRASEDNSDKKLKIAGADNVIMPDKIGGAHMASLVMKPDVIEFIDFITGQGGDAISLEEITFENLAENLQNKTLKDLEIRSKFGANIIGYKTENGEYVLNPSADTKIIPKAKIFVLGSTEELAKFKEHISG